MPNLTLKICPLTQPGGTVSRRTPYLRQRGPVPIDALPAGLTTWMPSFVAAELHPEMIENWVNRTSRAILDELPELARQPDLVKVLNESVHEHWLGFLAAFTQPDFPFHLVDGGVQLAREIAAHQLPVETLIKVYRAAQQESWTYVTGVVNAIPDDDVDQAGLLIYFWSRASAWIDESIGASIDIFQTERTRRLQGVSAQRYEIVKDLLGGHVADPRRVSAALGGYPLSVLHTALILETDDAQTVADLDKVGRDVARVLGGSRPLVVHPGGRQLWIWLGTRDHPDLSDLGQFEEALQTRRARLYVGIPAQGPDGFVSSHRDAERALHIAEQGSAWGTIMRYDEVEVVALLGCSPEVDRFVARTLGVLGADDDATERLRETVSAFLRHGGNVEDAAVELCVHRNTVRYRLGKAEELLSRPVARAGDELRLAIRHHELFHRADRRP